MKPLKSIGNYSVTNIHSEAALKSWLREFLFSCLHRLKIPKIWRRALVVAITKLTKPVEDPKSY